MRLGRNWIGFTLVGFALGGCGQPSASSGVTGGAGRGSGGAGGAGSATGGGAGGAAGTGDAGGAAGSGSTACSITATTTFSAAMPNVAIVTWSTTLANLTRAEIDFALASGGTTMVAPVDLTQASHRTVLLGMKGNSNYVYTIVASTAGGSCTSDSYPIVTGAVPASPAVTATIMDAESHDRGFIIASTGLTGNTTFIIDPDGAVVWSAAGPKLPSRAHMSWDGTQMYMMALNVQNMSLGNIQTVAMDGTGTTALPGLTASHHDLAAIPGGFATVLWNQSGTDAPCSLVERADDTGALTTVVADMGTVYTSKTFHTNSIHYYPTDDTYTVGDRNPSLYVKLTRAGQLVWQFGGSNPKDPSKFFTGVPTWSVNHGHQLLADGTFIFFNNGGNEAWVYALDTTAMTASKVLGYTASGAKSSVLGDVQRLPNGNYLVTFSTSGQIQEISPSGALVATFTSPTFGYAEFRESLYGAPPY